MPAMFTYEAQSPEFLTSINGGIITPNKTLIKRY